MGYYTTFSGVIDYSDVSKEKQGVIEKILEVIDVLQWSCSSSSTSQESINYYNEENQWIHYLYNIEIDKDEKKIDFTGERKDYGEATNTLLSLIAPYLNPNRVFVIEYNGEDDFDYDDDGEEVIPTPNEIYIRDGKVFIGKDYPFETDNQLSFPFPTIKPRARY